MFHIGQKVVCVDVSQPYKGLAIKCLHTGQIRLVDGHLDGLEKDKIYTTRGMTTSWIDGHPAVYVDEIIRNIIHNKEEVPYSSWRFGALIEKKLSTETGMTILRKIADEASKEKVDATEIR